MQTTETISCEEAARTWSDEEIEAARKDAIAYIENSISAAKCATYWATVESLEEVLIVLMRPLVKGQSETVGN